MYPKAAIIIKNLDNNWIELDALILKKVFISKMNKTPMKPIQIEINFETVNLSSLVKKWERIKVNIGPTPIKIPAVDDWICCSDQLIK